MKMIRQLDNFSAGIKPETTKTRDITEASDVTSSVLVLRFF